MRDLHWRDCWFPRLYAIEEISIVIERLVQFDLAQAVRQLVAVLPFRIGSVEPAAIHPNPAIAADPFGTAADVWVAAGDDHCHVLWIFATNLFAKSGRSF